MASIVMLRLHRLSRPLVVALVVALTAPTAMAQKESHAVTLRPATGFLSHEFTSIGSVRELSDGRVLVTDPGDDVIIVADLSADDVRTIGTAGAGPSEYRSLGKLIALDGDTTLMADQSNRRFLILHRGRIVAMLAPDDPLVATLGTTLIGSDTSARLLAIRVIATADVTKVLVAREPWSGGVGNLRRHAWP